MNLVSRYFLHYYVRFLQGSFWTKYSAIVSRHCILPNTGGGLHLTPQDWHQKKECSEGCGHLSGVVGTVSNCMCYAIIAKANELTANKIYTKQHFSRLE